MALKQGRKSGTGWVDEYFVRAYNYAKSGMSDAKIAKALGVTAQTFLNWKKKKPALSECLTEARGTDGAVTFQEYVYKQLSPDLRQLWKDLVESSKLKNGVARCEQLLAGQGVQTRQRLFVHALVMCNFDASKACRCVNISRVTLENWKKRDPLFLELLDEIDWHKANFFEGALCALVKDGHPNAVIFANRTYNAKRGYGDKSVVLHQHDHLHNVVSVDDLGLSLDVRKQLLEAFRQKQQADDVIDMPQLPAHEGEVDG